MTQSFQSMVESIATTGPNEPYVSKDVFQNCMASVANNIIQLAQCVNQLTWGLNTGIQTLTDKLETSIETAKISHENNSKMSERLNRLDSNHTKICNNITELSDRVNSKDTMNSKNITMLFDKLDKLEKSNSQIQVNIKDISDRLGIVESNNTSTHQTTVELSAKVSRVCESVDNLQTSSSALMSKYQEQQCSIVSLTDNISTLQEKSVQYKVIPHSTPKPPPGLPNRGITNTPFVLPKPPPGFQTAFLPLQRAIDLAPENLCLQDIQSSTRISGEFSPFLSNGFTDTDLFEEVPVSQADRDGDADLPKVSVAPTRSITNSPSVFVSTEGIMSPVPSQSSLQSVHSCAAHQSDLSFQPVPMPANACQSLESHTNDSSHCDSGIVSMLEQTSLQSSPTKTLLSLSDNAMSSPNQMSHITCTILSELSQIKTGEECSNELVQVYTNTSHQTVVIESFNSRDRQLLSLSQSKPVLALGHTIMPLPDKSLSVCTIQSAVSPVNSFEQVIQSDGHRLYGRLHPVRRPWQLIYNTLRWLKPFK